MERTTFRMRWAVRWARWVAFSLAVRAALVPLGHPVDDGLFALIVLLQWSVAVGFGAYVIERARGDHAAFDGAGAEGRSSVPASGNWSVGRLLQVAAWSAAVLAVGWVVTPANALTLRSLLLATLLGFVLSRGSHPAAAAHDQAPVPPR